MTTPGSNMKNGFDLLSLLGIDTTNLINATIHFKVNDIVRCEAEYEIHLPISNEKIKNIKQYYLIHVPYKLNCPNE